MDLSRWESQAVACIFRRCERRLNASNVGLSYLNRGSWFHAHTHLDRGSVHAYMHVCASDKEGAGGGRRSRVVDPASTVSSRIALLPANVCHVWHTRRAPRACGLRGAYKSARVRTCALISCVTFAASRRENTREFPIAVRASTACHVAAPNARIRYRLGYCRTRRQSGEKNLES